MISYVVGFMMIFSVVAAIIGGNLSDLTIGIMQGTADGVELIISICGGIIFWSGILNVADKCGITEFISKIISPFIHKYLFKNLKRNGEAMKNICMNISVNLLGLGNVATPLGLAAMNEIENEEGENISASDEMITFVVMNTASMQLMPTTTAFLRMQSGSNHPMEILPCVIISSATSLIIGVTMAKIISKRRCNRCQMP